MFRNGRTVVELLAAAVAMAILACVIMVNVERGIGEARAVRTQALIDEFKLGVEKYVSHVNKYPFVPAANGVIDADNCWRELAPYATTLSAGVQPGDPAYRNQTRVECLSLTDNEMADLGDGKLHVVDAWKKPFCMQWDYFNRKAMIWSAGEDGEYNISDDPIAGGPSNLFCRRSEAQTQSFRGITEEDKECRIDRDLSNY